MSTHVSLTFLVPSSQPLKSDKKVSKEQNVEILQYITQYVFYQNAIQTKT
jgi:hypothetical protein